MAIADKHGLLIAQQIQPDAQKASRHLKEIANLVGVDNLEDEA
jgi:hypothetical protein